MPAASAWRRGMAARCTATPIQPRRTRPWLRSSPSTKAAVLEATAKQMPCAPMMTAVLMPTTSPARGDQRAAGIAGVQRRIGLDQVLDQPPALPAQRAAERRDHAGGDGRLRSRADCRSPPPAGRACSAWELPSRAPAASPDRRRAAAPGRCRDRRRARARSGGGRRRRDLHCAAAPSTTWLLVRTRPSGETMTPEPTPPRRGRCGLARFTRTTAGPTASATEITALE